MSIGDVLELLESLTESKCQFLVCEKTGKTLTNPNEEELFKLINSLCEKSTLSYIKQLIEDEVESRNKIEEIKSQTNDLKRMLEKLHNFSLSSFAEADNIFYDLKFILGDRYETNRKATTSKK